MVARPGTREKVKVEPTFQSVRTGEGPLVEATFRRTPWPADAEAAFSPFRLPERVGVLLRDIEARQIRQGKVEFEARLLPGEHPVPLGEGPAFRIRVEPGTVGCGHLEVGPADPGPWATEPVLRRASLEFTPPLVLTNVMETLVQVHQLFEDRDLAALLGVASWMAALPAGRALRAAVMQRIAQSGLFEGSGSAPGAGAGLVPTLASRARGFAEDLKRRWGTGELEPGEVWLSGVKAHPRWRASTGRWELEISFSGHVRLMDAVTYPFWDVVLPSSILPVPFAGLAELLTERPLASGRLTGRGPQPLQVARVIRDALEGFAASVFLEADPPELGGRTRLADRTDVVARARIPGPVSIAATVRAERAGSDRFSVDVPEARLGFGPEGALSLRARATAAFDLDTPGRAPVDRVSGELSVDLVKGSSIPWIGVETSTSHPLAEAVSSLEVRCEDVRVRGGLDLAWAGGEASGTVREPVTVEARVTIPDGEWVRRRESRMLGALRDGRLSLTVRPDADGDLKVGVKGTCRLSNRLEATVSPIPELNIADSRLQARVESRLSLDAALLLRLPGRKGGGFSLSPSGGLDLGVDTCVAELDGRRLEVPGGTRLAGRWRQGAISAKGLGSLAFDLAWDLQGKPCLLHGPDRCVSLLTEALRRGDLTVHLSPGGRLGFSGEGEGLFGIRFFKALLNPAGEPGYLLDLLESDEALAHVISALTVFNPELADRVDRARHRILRCKEHLDRLGVKEPRDVIPRQRIATILSLFLADDESLAPRLEPLIRDVTEGRGLDVAAARQIVEHALPDLGQPYEVDRVLRWLDLVTRPVEAGRPGEQVPEEPVSLDPRYRAALDGLPSAAEIYRAVEAPSPDPAFLQQLADLSPYLTLSQLDHVLSRAGDRWPAATTRRLRRVAAAKRAVSRLDEGYGGLEFAVQASSIAGFLGEAVGRLPGIDPDGDDWPPPCALGPVDVATLLVAGLSEGRQGLQAQLNNRLLLELLRSRPDDFTREVLVEMGRQVPRILAGVLFAFLQQDQDQIRDPVDLPAFLGQKLGRDVPRQEDFMAGGRRVRESYYEALSDLADLVFAQAGPYLARRAHLREVRHAPLPGPRAEGPAVQLERDARRSIEAADRLGARVGRTFAGAVAGRARDAYLESFQATARFLEALPTGFRLPWMKAWWARNEEALKVLSVVRNVQEDVDDVRPWLRVQTGRDLPSKEQDLVETVVRALWARPEDQDALLADPLVRLLVDPPPGRYDFTLVSAMGVITDGERGRELEDAYRRLADRRGVRVIRADTGLWRSLEYNAAAVIRAVKRTRGPWGWMGYSQGCANGLLAESFLRGGAPADRRLLDRLVCRNLLFSAANGSVHGSAGSLKFVRAMADGERFLKHYQAEYSRELIDVVLRGFKAALDSHLFVAVLGGTHSLTFERARVLHREGQFVPWVPTSTTRAVTAPDRVPEALEFLYWVHGRQLPGIPNDTQVCIDEAVGHATRVRNAWTDEFADCDMGSMPQASHHWSPLTAEVEMVTTPRDRALAIYQGPKDRHVFPWVEVNARFGRIRGATPHG